MESAMRKSRFKWVTLGAMTLLLSGCAIDKEGCDPAALKNAGFFTKASCDFSGSYQARADDQQVQLEQAKRERDLLQNSVKQLENENRRLEQGITLKRAQRDRLVASLNATLAAIAQENSSNQALMDQIDKAQQEIDALNELPDSTNPAAIQKRIRTVQNQITELENHL